MQLRRLCSFAACVLLTSSAAAHSNASNQQLHSIQLLVATATFMVPTMKEVHADRRLRWFSLAVAKSAQPYFKEQEFHADPVDQPWWHLPVANSARIVPTMLDIHAD